MFKAIICCHNLLCSHPSMHCWNTTLGLTNIGSEDSPRGECLSVTAQNCISCDSWHLKQYVQNVPSWKLTWSSYVININLNLQDYENKKIKNPAHRAGLHFKVANLWKISKTAVWSHKIFWFLPICRFFISKISTIQWSHKIQSHKQQKHSCSWLTILILNN